MTNDPAKVRALLEPFGYAFGVHRGADWCARPGERNECLFQRDKPEEVALTHLLNDKAQTGAKLELLQRICGSPVTIANVEGASFKCSPAYGSYAAKWLPAPTVDEAVNRLLLCVHDLDGPRGGAQ